MQLEPNVFDVWTFRRRGRETDYLLLHTSQLKADRWFNGGRFWQIPSHFVGGDEKMADAVARVLGQLGLAPAEIWAAEYAYTIYNRRFEAVQIINVFAAAVEADEVTLDPAEHDEYRWCGFDEALRLVTYRGLKDGLASTREYITGRESPPRELRLR